MRLLYVGDPMCSWCWGFAPVLEAVQARYHLPVELLMGGLRAGTAAQPLDDTLRSYLLAHWQQVEAVSGQPFNRRGLERSGWRYDTELACRAVVVARSQGTAVALDLFKTLQQAFYRDAIDLTDAAVYPPLVSAVGLETEGFMTLLGDENSRQETYRDFATAGALGVRGFPTLLLVDGERLRLHLGGYRPAAALTALLDRELSASDAPST